jgi:Cu-Zn family superoxide dismutase
LEEAMKGIRSTIPATTARRGASVVAALAAALAATLAGGCAHLTPGPSAKADLAPTRGNTTAGTVTFRQSGGEMTVHARVTGLKPGQEHGFHIHEKGDCSSGDGMSAGGHFNPDGRRHGAQHEEHHAGDLPSLKADAAGVADMRFTVKGLAIGSGAADIVGKGLIVHAMPDDYKTQPTGNSGARIACAVIVKSD